MNAILLSVKPVYVRAILAGTKTAEVRRRFPDQTAGTVVFLYSSSPDRAVIGTASLDRIERPEASRVWDLYRGQIEIERAPLDDYLEAVENAAILRLSAATRWARPVPLVELRRRIGVEPPQSFRYLNRTQSSALLALGEVRLPVDVTVVPKLVAVG